MKTLLIKTLYAIPFFIISCSTAQVPTYVENYECIEAYLKLKGINTIEPDILVLEKVVNFQTLRAFNGSIGIEHSDESYTPKLYNKKDWEILYRTYINDTLVKHWKNTDFPNINFISGSERDARRGDFLDIYPYTTKQVISLSEPICYSDNKYVMFYYSKSAMGLYGYGKKLVVIMKIENGKWVVVEEVKDYSTPM